MLALDFCCFATRFQLVPCVFAHGFQKLVPRSRVDGEQAVINKHGNAVQDKQRTC
jgi:hypothetical protein